jgi:ubiquinone/menaquinone biosynthesis C-methylase UbiE
VRGKTLSQDQIKDRVRKQFGGTAAGYAVSATHRAGNDLDRLVETAECRPDVEALDIATGAGHTARAIAPHVAHVIASDLTPEMLDTARSEILAAGLANVSFRVADAEDLPFDDETFDLVACRIAPHHFPNVEKFIQEAARVVRPGGLFLLLESTAPEDPELAAFLNELEYRRDNTHILTSSVDAYRQMIESTGLVIELTEDFPKTHNFADWTARSKMNADDLAALEQWLLDAPEQCRAQFRVEVTDGRVQSFTDRKTLFKCRKPSQ